MSAPQRGRRRAVVAAALVVLALGAAACGGDDESQAGGGGGDEKYKIALIQSYSGNDWQNAAANLIKAVAATPPYKDRVELDHQIAGTDPQKQSKLITDEISAGADALVIYPISPTAINAAVKKACDQGVLVVTYDSWTEEPCTYNVHSDGTKLAEARVEWLADHLGGKGKIAEIIGVAGTAFDTIHQEAVDKALEKYPGIELVAREEGFWAQPGARDAITKLISAHPDLDGYIAQVGCWGATQKLLDLGKKALPCAGAESTGHLRMMLPKGETDGAIGLPGMAASVTVYTGALAFLQAFNILDGGDAAKDARCHETIIDPPAWTNDDLAVGDDPTKPGNVYPVEHVPSVPPGFFGDFYSPLVGQGLNGALSGSSDQVSAPGEPVKTAGDDEVDGVASGGGQDCLVP